MLVPLVWGCAPARVARAAAWLLLFVAAVTGTARAQSAGTTRGTHDPGDDAERACGRAHTEAQVLRGNGSLLGARKQLLRCAQGDCPALIIQDCARWLPEVELSISSVVFAVSGPSGDDIVNARVLDATGRVIAEQTDGRAVPIDPGTYRLRVEAKGYAPAQTTVAMHESEKNRIVRVALVPLVSASTVAAPLPDEPARKVPLASFILGGTALLGGVTFAYFGLAGEAELRKFQRCDADQQCEAPFKKAGVRDYVVADIGLGVGIASLTASVLFYFLTESEPPAPADKARACVEPLLGPGGAALRVSGRF